MHRGVFRPVDVPSLAWHSRQMLHRSPVRQLLLTIVLSQVLVIQGLLLTWGGTLAIAGGTGGLGAICYGAKLQSDGETERGPREHGPHHDCLSACLMNHTTAPPPDKGISQASPTLYAPPAVSRETALIAILREPVFLARAPPMLT